MKTILSIDGGGIRGLLPAITLAEIERRTARPVSDCFDLIAGTSTGGILALGLAMRRAGDPQFTASELVDIYETHGARIFPHSLLRELTSVAGLTAARHSAYGLESVLREYLGDTPLREARTRVLLTAYDLQNRRPIFFKSWRSKYNRVLMRHAARATSAAPTYFQPTEMRVGGDLVPLVDGGVFINSPPVSAYAEAVRIFPEERDFLLVSLGTGKLTRAISFEQAADWGKLQWASPLIDCIFDGVADAADYQMRKILDASYFRFQGPLTHASDDLDNASPENIAALKADARELVRCHDREIDRACAVLKKHRTDLPDKQPAG